ncbi:ABC transporter permease [Paenibacillus sp. OAS669]|uniref:ABC transporter permease n=1 Tax=Paenibacillus sp. OAS669 TaxID=2663821 RepID=UPI0017890F5C|nr:ABC transporter permease subunit [Paenibacillus sp. OAS669]MBE1446867.1 putative aldouronate transport system permease protein [Paenibacillus sp. OAS669]
MELKHELAGKGVTVPRSKIAFLKRELVRNKYVYLMLVPVLAYYLIFHYGPMYGLLMAFQKSYSPVKGIFAGTWIGLDNFITFFKSFYFWRLLRNTVVLSFYSIVFGFPAPIVLALLLHEVRSKVFKRTVQTVSYLPHFISVVVVVGMLKAFSSLDGGLFNVIRSLFSLGPVMFFTESDMFRPMYILSNIWQGAGWASIIFLAALSNIDSQLYEAAKVDGAGRWKQLLHITIPGIMPTMIIMLILRLGAIMNADFQKILLMQTASTYEVSDVISTFVYRSGVLEANYTYSTAIGLFNGVINFSFLVIANTLSRKANSTSLW